MEKRKYAMRVCEVKSNGHTKNLGPQNCFVSAGIPRVSGFLLPFWVLETPLEHHLQFRSKSPGKEGISRAAGGLMSRGLANLLGLAPRKVRFFFGGSLGPRYGRTQVGAG